LNSVHPSFPAINEYLDEHDSDEAHVLANVAEGAMEASFEIKRRAE